MEWQYEYGDARVVYQLIIDPKFVPINVMAEDLKEIVETEHYYQLKKKFEKESSGHE